jgi:hypothetical protein
MDELGHQRPRQTRELFLVNQLSHPIEAVSSVRMILEDPPPLNCAQHHVMSGTRSVEASLPTHSRFH